MIFSSLMGGLGNQLFQIAAGIAHAENTGSQYAMDLSLCYTPNQGKIAADYKHSLYKNITIATLPEKIPTYSEVSFEYRRIPNIKSLYIKGYFQSWKYFNDHKPLIKNIIQNPQSYKTKARVLVENYGIDFERFQTVHVRRGDYVNFSNTFEILDASYYKKTIPFLEKNKLPIIVVSDEIGYAQSILNDRNFFYVNSSDELMDFTLLANSCATVISNSSFAWWSTYLSEVKKDLIIAPSQWFCDKSYNTKDLLPPEWTVL